MNIPIVKSLVRIALLLLFCTCSDPADSVIPEANKVIETEIVEEAEKDKNSEESENNNDTEKTGEKKDVEKPKENKEQEKPEDNKESEKPEESIEPEKPKDNKEPEKPAENKPAEKPKENKPAESKPAEKPKENKPAESKPAEKPKENKPKENKPAEKPKENKDKPEIPKVPEIVKKTPVFRRGENSVVFTSYEPLRDKPITIHYYIPTKGDLKQMPILFSFHGSDRDGTIQRDAWKYFAEEYGFIVLAPEFSRTYYTMYDYQHGSIYTNHNNKTLNDKKKWTFHLVEAIFDYFKEDTGNKSHSYNMFGHSAGGQFVHRFLYAIPDARVNKAVASNPGAWTLPYKDGIVGTDKKIYGWPCSVKNTPFASDHYARKFFEKTLIIQLGTADSVSYVTGMPNDPPSNAQGAHRHARGKFFFSESQKTANRMNLSFKFRLAEVKDVGHSTRRMVYGKPASYNPKNVRDVGRNCAFELLYR